MPHVDEILSEAQEILIVDDNEEDYTMAAYAFKKFNLRNKTVWCRSGQEALDYLRHEGAFKEIKPAPGLVLLDLNMPGMGGHETLRIIKNDKALKSIPVIMLTSSDSKNDITSCFQDGANSYVQKPVSFEKMITAIKGLNEYWFEISLLPKEDFMPAA
jgi:two-component system response regulator